MTGRLMRAWVGAIAIAAAASTPACLADNAAPRSSDLGASQLDSTDVACTSDDQCKTGETCGNGVCQMKRCAAPSYASVSPLGAMGYFKLDRELVVVGDDTQIQGYELDDRSFVRPNGAAWASPTGRIVDVAGGNVLGSRPEALVFATEGSKVLEIRAGSQKKTVQLGFVPVAVAVADVDADETDDVIAVSREGQVSVCRATDGTCQTLDGRPAPQGGAAPAPFEVIDATAGDVDGDGYAEVVLLTKKSFVVVNFDTAKTGHTKVVEMPVDKEFLRVAAGDLDGDGVAEVAVVYDGITGDDLRTFSLRSGSVVPKGTLSTSNGSVDLAVGMFGGREKTEIALLRRDDTTEMFTLDAQGKLVSEYKSLLSTSNVTRIAAVDFDGDSPARRVKGAPKLMPGEVVPVAVLTLPPYSRTHSDGRSSVSVGRGSEKGQTRSDGTVFSVEAGLGFTQELSIFAKVVEVEVEAHFSQETWKTRGVSRSLSKSATFEIEAKPENEGYDGGAVVVGCGCYHQYEYVLDDPAHKLGQDLDGKAFSVFVPVDAQTTVMSTRRYNALAEALGGGRLPKITLPYQLGRVASYPDKPVTLDGKVIPQEDMVFLDPPTLRVNDVASTSFELAVEEGETNEKLVYTGGGISGSIGVFGVTASGAVDALFLKGYSVSVSQSSTFSGTVPPLRNDPTTPEDELKLHGYSFTPLLYRQHYKDGAGRDGAFMVLSYAVGK